VDNSTINLMGVD